MSKVDYREILRLDSLHYSRKRISISIGSSHHTVKDVLDTATQKGITWPLDNDVTNAELEALLFPDKRKTESIYAELDYAYMPVLIAAFYGMRRGEVLGLKWDAIDFERGTISVLRTVVTALDESGKTVEIEQQCAKTKSGLRTLPLVSQFRDYFLQLRQAQELNKKICGNCYNHDYDGFVMVDEMGDRIKLEYISKQFPIFLQRHGLKRMRFHDLRHSCASLLLANGVPLKCIQEWLGHSDFTITANIYAHLDYSSKLSSAQAMERGLPLPENDFGSRWVTVGYYDNAGEISSSLLYV